MRWKDYEVAAMRRALELARRGLGKVEPNPMVGAVVVRSGRIIAEGFHHRFGGAHAEVDALAAAGARARGAEMFITLEPCSHYGKRPPCADVLISAGISRVVVAIDDPFHLVRGRGLARLKKACLQVDVGLLAREARDLNAPFTKLRTTGLPYAIAKFAMTADGNIATASGDSRWISSEVSRRTVHALRGRVDAIIIGVDTAIADDPLLTARPPGPRIAARVVLDAHARLPLSSKLVRTALAPGAYEFPLLSNARSRRGSTKAPLIVAVTASAPRARVNALRARGAGVIVLPGHDLVSVRALLAELGRMEMTNVLVEGGAHVLGSFFAARSVDEVIAFVAPKLIGKGLSPIAGWGVKRMRDAVTLLDVTYEPSGPDVMIRARIQ
jgi:diaminohydroxyphosphoribosylaminopyrimidine deaminase/5-amino-6-(5-phosphoribosylamino)uracil reductase